MNLILWAALAVEVTSFVASNLAEPLRWAGLALNLAAIVPALWLSHRQPTPPRPAWARGEFLTAGIVVSVWVVLRAFSWDTVPLWLDEYTQFQHTLDKNDPAHVALFHLQPPNACVFSHTLGLLFGSSMHAVRLSAAIPSLGALMLWLSTARRHGGVAAMLPLAAFLLLDHAFFFHSLEGRGGGLAILWASFAYAAAADHRRDGDRTSAARWFAGSLLLLLSIGLQSGVLVLTATAALLAVGLACRERNLQRLGWLSLTAGLLFLPLQAYMTWFSAQQGWLAREGVWPVSGLDWRKFALPSDGSWPVALILWGSAVVGIVGRGRRGTWAAAGALVLFPPIITALFYGLISYIFYRRYIEVWWLVAGAAALIAPWRGRETKSRARLIVAAVTALMLAVSLTWRSWPQENYRALGGWRWDWQELFSYLGREEHANTRFYVHGPPGYGAYSFHLFVGPEFAASPSLQARLGRSNYNFSPFTDTGLLQDTVDHRHHGRWALVVPPAGSQAYERLGSPQGGKYEVLKVGAFMLLTSVGVAPSPRTFLEALVEGLPKEAAFHRTHELLVRVLLLEGDRPQARRRLAGWAALPGHNEAFAQIPSYRRGWEDLQAAAAP